MSTTQMMPTFIKTISKMALDNRVSNSVLKKKQAAKEKRAKEVAKKRATEAKQLAKDMLKQECAMKKLEAVAAKEAVKAEKVGV